MLVDGKFLNIRTSSQGRALILHLQGRLDATTAQAFDRACQTALADPNQSLIIDMHELSYVSSAGLRSILILHKTCAQQPCGLHFCALQESVAEVFEVSAFDRILSIYPTLEEALHAQAIATT